MNVEARNTASHRGEALRLMRSILNRLLLASDEADSTGSQMEDGHDLVIMKLGGAVITDKNVPFTARHQVIWRVAQEIHQARQSRPFRLIVVHGGGSYPHVYARQYQTHLGVQGTESYSGLVGRRWRRMCRRILIVTLSGSRSLLIRAFCPILRDESNNLFLESFLHAASRSFLRRSLRRMLVCAVPYQCQLQVLKKSIPQSTHSGFPRGVSLQFSPLSSVP